MTKKFYLIRHGQKMTQVGNPPLTRLGILQAQTTGQYLQNLAIQKISASPLLRTQQTAEYLATTLFLPIQTQENLKERFNWSVESGKTYREFLDIWKKSSQNRDWQSPLGDSSRMAGSRLENVIASDTDQTTQIVLVTHGGIISDFLRNTFGDQQMPDAEAVPECSITTIEYDQTSKKYTLRGVTAIDHLRSISANQLTE